MESRLLSHASKLKLADTSSPGLRTYAIENDEASLADLSRSISPHTAPVSNPAYTPTASFVNKSSTSSAGMAYAGSYGERHASFLLAAA